MTSASYTREFAELTKAEFHLIHHALRMLAKYPGDDREAATELADEMWGLHSRRVNEDETWRSGLWRQRS